MTREEWYKHKTLDAIQQVNEYVELIMNGDMASHMSDSETSNVYHRLSMLNSDIIGRQETEVVTTGKLQISKKDFTNLTNRAAALLELFLHGFMQERKELEAAQNDH